MRNKTQLDSTGVQPVEDVETMPDLDDPLEAESEPGIIPIIDGPKADRNGTQPLPAINFKPASASSAPRGSRPPITVVQCSDVGSVRDHNEDACLTFIGEGDGSLNVPPFAFFLVADGMGGHHDGQEASRQATRTVAALILQQIYQPLMSNRDHSGEVPIQDVLVDAVQSANYQIHSPRPELDSGTTLTAALVLGKRLFLAHVGDSRAYLLSNGELRQLTDDHSFVQRLQQTGQLSPLEAASHPQRNVLYRAVGQGPNLEVDTSTRQLPAEGLLLLCSDGLWGLVSDEIIKETLCRQELTLAARNDILVEAALLAGGYDNVTSVLASFSW